MNDRKKKEALKNESKDSNNPKRISIFEALFGELGEMIKFVIGMFTFIGLFMIAPALFVRLMDFISPNEKKEVIMSEVPDSLFTAKLIENKVFEIDSLLGALDNEVEGKKLYLREKIEELESVEKASYIVDSIREEYDIQGNFARRKRDIGIENYVNWIISALITLLCGTFFYWRGKHAGRSRLQKQANSQKKKRGLKKSSK